MAFSVPVPARVSRAANRLLDSPRLQSWLRPSFPPHAVEVTSRALIAVAVARGKDGARLAAHRVVPLEAGLVQPNLVRPAIADPEAFRVRLRDSLKGLPGFDGSFSLVLPDRMAKVTFVDLEETATTLGERAEIIRWKLKRSTPFRVEDARTSFQTFRRSGGGMRCLVALVQNQVVEQFESAAEALGWNCGLVDLSSFNLWNLMHGQLAGEGDHLLLNVDEDSSTAIIARAGEPLFVRCKGATGGDVQDLAGVQSELHTTLLYYQDRIGGSGVQRAVLRAPEAMEAGIARTLSERYGIVTADQESIGIGGLEALSRAERSTLAPALGSAYGR